MTLLPTEKQSLLEEFNKRVAYASQIDIAVAWVGNSQHLIYSKTRPANGTSRCESLLASRIISQTPRL